MKLRLLERRIPTYEIEPLLRKAMEQREMVDELRVSRSYWESRASQAMEVEDVLRSHRHCVITGDPGAGKTTLLKHLTLEVLGSKLKGLPDLPVYLSLSKFAQFLRTRSGQRTVNGSARQPDLLDYAASEWERLCGMPRENARKYVGKRLEAGDVLLLLDALDEAGIGEDEAEQKEMQQQVADEVKGFRNRYGKAHIVATARTEGYMQIGGLPGFEALETLDFGPDDIHKFIENWFKAEGEQDKAEKLNSELDRNARLASLAANPLLLSLIATVYVENLKLPEQRAELYKRCIVRLLGENSSPPGRRRKFTGIQKQLVLERVAWEFQCNGQRYLEVERLSRILTEACKDAGVKPYQENAILRELDIDDGLLKEQALRQYGFLHRTIQEYFASRYAMSKGLLDELLRHSNDASWEEVILLSADIAENPTLFLQKLLDKEDVFFNNLNLAGRCLAAMPTQQQPRQMRDSIIDKLFMLMYSDTFQMIRQLAAGTLAELGRTEQDVRQGLIALLSNRDTDQEVSESLIRALGEFSDSAIANELLPLLAKTDLAGGVTHSITSALVRLRNNAIVPGLFAFLANKNLNPFVRADAASIICNLGDTRQAPELAKFLLDEKEHKAVRTDIALGWAALGDQSMLPQMAGLLVDPQLDPLIALGILDALRQVGIMRFADKLGPMILDTHIDLHIRAYIAGTLVIGGDPATVQGLLLHLFEPQLPERILENMLEAYGERGDTSIVPVLQRLHHERHLNQQEEVTLLITLTRLGDHSVDDDLRQLLLLRTLTRDQYRSILRQLGLQTQLSTLLNGQAPIESRIPAALENSTTQDTSIVEPLRKLVADKNVPQDIRRECFSPLRALAADRKTAESLAEVINTETILANDAMRTLWTVSRKALLRVVQSPLTRVIVIVDD